MDYEFWLLAVFDHPEVISRKYLGNLYVQPQNKHTLFSSGAARRTE